MAKDIAKSIRLSQEDFDFIDSYEGETFSEKLDNMIAMMHTTLPEKQKELQRIENTIQAKREEFRRISRYMSDLEDIVTRSKRIVTDLKTVESLIYGRFKLVLPSDADSIPFA